jgi:hypothetical protein
MPQLSRPFQIVMVVFVLFAGVWLFVLQGHSTSNSGSTPAVSSTAAVAAGTANTHGSASSSSATTGAKSHGSGSSLGSLGHAIAKAHHAAAVSQQNAHQLEAKSAAQSNEAAATQSTGSATHTPSKASTHKASATSSAAAKPAVKPSTSTGKSPTHKSSGSAGSASSKLIPSGQRSVEADLAKGNVVVLLFWNPAGTDDALTFLALQPLTKAPKVSVQAAPASAVANYGSITRGVQVYATPTILVINKQGKAIVLTGLQDTYAITQAIGEARSSS